MNKIRFAIAVVIAFGALSGSSQVFACGDYDSDTQSDSMEMLRQQCEAEGGALDEDNLENGPSCIFLPPRRFR